MRAEIFWIPGPWPGRLGIVPRPRGGDWLEDEASTWRGAGIELVVSLLEPEEQAQLILEGEAAAAAAAGVEFTAYPIPDRGVPSSQESAAELVSDIVNALESGKSVAVHCRQGIGRSGLIVGAVFVATGSDIPTALKIIERARGAEVPETEQQRQWLMDFASRQRARPAARRADVANRPRRRVSH